MAHRDGAIFVLPHGTVPVGLSGDENATTGNNAAHIVPDSAGFMHMVWQDGGRSGGPTGAFYRRATVTSSGDLRLETGPISLSPSGGQWNNAYPSLAAAGPAVHFVWQQAGTVHYRHLLQASGAGRWSDPIDLHAPSDGRDVGLAIDAASGALHVVTPRGYYAISRDGGANWNTSRIADEEPLGHRTTAADYAHAGIATSSLVRILEPRTSPV